MGQLSQLAPEQIQGLQEQRGINLNDPNQLNEFVDAEVANNLKGFDAIKKFRGDVYASSTTRSILITFFGIGILALFFYTSIPSIAIAGGLAVLMLIDFIPVDTNYIGSMEKRDGTYVHWVPEQERAYPIAATEADYAILANELQQNPRLQGIVDAGSKKGAAKAREMEYSRKYQTRVEDAYKFAALNANTNYRVFDTDGGFGSSRASYYHKSIGGYHGAKLRTFQNLAEFHMYSMNNKVLDMLNVKYVIQQGQLRPNSTALGNAWLVSEVKAKATANDEIRALGSKFDLKNTGSGTFLVNRETKKTASVYGQEKLQYVIDKLDPATQRNVQDTLEVKLTNGLQVGQTAAFVIDTKGQAELVPIQTLENDTTRSFQSLVTITLKSQFNPSNEVVMLDSEAKKLTQKKFSKDGNVSMTKYAPNQINYSADVKGKQLIVFSEMYYNDGWKAYVDGKEKEILRVDYALRGLEVDGGKHKIEFKFDLPKYHTAGTLSMIGSTLILLFVAGMLILDWRKKKTDEEIAVKD